MSLRITVKLFLALQIRTNSHLFKLKVDLNQCSFILQHPSLIKIPTIPFYQKSRNSFSYSYLSQLEMANPKRDIISADNALSNRMPSNISASNGNYPRPLQPMAPSAPPIHYSHPTWAANLFPGRAYYQQLPAPNANFARSASSPSHVHGARRPNTNRPNYTHPAPINLWNCCQCNHPNHPENCPVLCGLCPHNRCLACPPTPDRHMPSTVRL